RPAAGGLLFDYFSDELQRLDPIDDSQILYWYKGAADTGQPARFYAVDRAIPATSEAEAWAQVTAPEFDPYRTVVLEPPPGRDLPGAAALPAARGTVAVLDETDTRIRLRLNRDHPGYLVLTTTHYPGWKATVN